MAIEKRFEQLYCEKCVKVHWVQVLGRDNNLCLGPEFVPNLKETVVSYNRFWMKGLDVREKAKKPMRKSLKTNFKHERVVPVQIEPDPSRRCVAELGMPTPAGYASVRVFEDATPERFYEWFWKAGAKPQKINSADIGTGEPLDLKGFAAFFKVQDKANMIIHDRNTYNRLLENARQHLAGQSF